MRVDELLNLFDLQDPVFVDFNGCDEHRFIRRIRPCTGLHFVCELWGKYTLIACSEVRVRDTDVNDHLSWSLYDGTVGCLSKDLAAAKGGSRSK